MRTLTASLLTGVAAGAFALIAAPASSQTQIVPTPIASPASSASPLASASPAQSPLPSPKAAAAAPAPPPGLSTGTTQTVRNTGAQPFTGGQFGFTSTPTMAPLIVPPAPGSVPPPPSLTVPGGGNKPATTPTVDCIVRDVLPESGEIDTLVGRAAAIGRFSAVAPPAPALPTAASPAPSASPTPVPAKKMYCN